ncbi:LLM class flavin-dependent oxidoreductase [Streptomyces sp. NPDC001286]
MDNLAAYGDSRSDPTQRYDRTREFLHLVRRLWTEEDVTFDGEHFQVGRSTVAPRLYATGTRAHPTLYFGGASEAAERVSAAEADVQLFWGEPLDGLAERIDRLKALSEQVGRRHRPLEFGLRITTVVRDTTEEAWHAAEERVARMAAEGGQELTWAGDLRTAVGQRRLLDLAARGEVLDTCLYTTPGKFGGGGAGTTLAGRLRRRRRHGAARLPQARHHPLRPLRHPLQAGGQPRQRSVAAPAALTVMRWSAPDDASSPPRDGRGPSP